MKPWNPAVLAVGALASLLLAAASDKRPLALECDDAVPPGPLTSLTLRSDAPVVEWAPVATAQSYDAVSYTHLTLPTILRV